jgi:hypothetical protein
MPFLLQQVASISRGNIYAREGEPVTIIAEHGTVLIVARTDGFRFPVLRSLVSDDPISISEKPVPKIDTPVQEILPRKAARKKVDKSALPSSRNQTTMF